jgi:hypothetical protein
MRAQTAQQPAAATTNAAGLASKDSRAHLKQPCVYGQAHCLKNTTHSMH